MKIAILSIVIVIPLTLGLLKRDQFRAELDDAPAVLRHSRTLKWIRGDERMSIGCIRSAPPDTAIRRLVREVDDVVSEWRYGSSVIVRK